MRICALPNATAAYSIVTFEFDLQADLSKLEFFLMSFDFLTSGKTLIALQLVLHALPWEILHSLQG